MNHIRFYANHPTTMPLFEIHEQMCHLLTPLPKNNKFTEIAHRIVIFVKGIFAYIALIFATLIGFFAYHFFNYQATPIPPQPQATEPSPDSVPQNPPSSSLPTSPNKTLSVPSSPTSSPNTTSSTSTPRRSLFPSPPNIDSPISALFVPQNSLPSPSSSIAPTQTSHPEEKKTSAASTHYSLNEEMINHLNLARQAYTRISPQYKTDVSPQEENSYPSAIHLSGLCLSAFHTAAQNKNSNQTEIFNCFKHLNKIFDQYCSTCLTLNNLIKAHESISHIRMNPKLKYERLEDVVSKHLQFQDFNSAFNITEKMKNPSNKILKSIFKLIITTILKKKQTTKEQLDIASKSIPKLSPSDERDNLSEAVINKFLVLNLVNEAADLAKQMKPGDQRQRLYEEIAERYTDTGEKEKGEELLKNATPLPSK